MEYIPNTAGDQKEMLRTIGVSSLEDLLSHIPAGVRLKRALALPEPISELELLAEMHTL